MDWFEVIISVPVQYTEKCAGIANMAVDYGIYIEDYSDLEEEAQNIAHIDLIDEKLIDMDRTKSKIHIYLEKQENVNEALFYLENRLSDEKIPFEVSIGNVAEINWNEYWKTFFHTTLIGERLAVVPRWEEYDNAENRCILKIDPGAAFGTGTHATTSLCLQMLEKYVNAESNVLDIGCGSGILAIASVLLGANKGFGVDIDAVAVKVAKENAVMNGIAEKIEFVEGDLADKVKGKYNIICANIVADVIIRLLVDVENYLEENGVVILSGIIDTRAQDVLDSIKANGYKVVEEVRLDNWYAFLINKGEVN